MTREELKEKFSEDITRFHSYGFGGVEDLEIIGKETDIDGIIDYFENRTCESCVYYSQTFNDGVERSDPICTCQDSNCNDIFVNRDFCCNRYEPKDQL